MSRGGRVRRLRGGAPSLLQQAGHLKSKGERKKRRASLRRVRFGSYRTVKVQSGFALFARPARPVLSFFLSPVDLIMLPAWKMITYRARSGILPAHAIPRRHPVRNASKDFAQSAPSNSTPSEKKRVYLVQRFRPVAHDELGDYPDPDLQKANFAAQPTPHRPSIAKWLRRHSKRRHQIRPVRYGE